MKSTHTHTQAPARAHTHIRLRAPTLVGSRTTCTHMQMQSAQSPLWVWNGDLSGLSNISHKCHRPTPISALAFMMRRGGMEVRRPPHRNDAVPPDVASFMLAPSDQLTSAEEHSGWVRRRVFIPCPMPAPSPPTRADRTCNTYTPGERALL